MTTQVLSTFATVHYGAALKEAERNNDGDRVVYGSSGEVGRHTEALVDYPTIIIGRKGSVGKVSYAPAGGWPIDTAFYLELKDPGAVDLRYLYWVLNSTDLKSLSITTSVPGLSREDLYRVRVPMPDLTEQRRIAELLDRADAVRRKREESRRLVDELLRSVFLEMFGDPVRNEKGWEVKRIGDLCRVLGGKRLPKGSAYSETPTPFRYVRATDIDQGRVDESNLRYLTQEVQARIARYTVSEGDLIITIAGTIGEVAPVEASLEGVNLTENAAKLCAIQPGVYDPHFLAALFRDPGIKASLLAQTGQVTIQKLALFRIERVVVPVPPLDLQRAYAERARSIDQLRSGLDAAAAKTVNLGLRAQHDVFGI